MTIPNRNSPSDVGDAGVLISNVTFTALPPDRMLRGDLLEVAFVFDKSITVRSAILQVIRPQVFALNFAGAKTDGLHEAKLSALFAGRTEALVIDAVFHELQRVALAASMWAQCIVISDLVTK